MPAAPHIFKIEIPMPFLQSSRWIGIVNAVLLALALALLIVEAGVSFARTETHQGPFAIEEATAEWPDNKSVVLKLQPFGPFGLLQARGDSSSQPGISRLRLTVAGRPYGSPHAARDQIRAGEADLFSHRGGTVRFALQPGIVNSPATIATVTYPIQPGRWVTIVLLWLLAGAWFGANWSTLTRERAARLFSLPVRLVLGLVRVGIVACIVYACATALAMMTGAALPTAAFIKRNAIIEWLAMKEPQLAFVLIFLSGAAAASHWAMHLTGLSTSEFQRDGARLRKLLARWGFPLLVAWLVFSASAPWAGLTRSSDNLGSSLAGLVPFSDAGGYYAEANDLARDGTWETLSARRPIAAAMRSSLLFLAGYSYSAMVMLQLFLFAGATIFAARAITRWKGIWVGIAFTAILTVVARSYLTHALTELLGLIVALCAIPFFIAHLRTGQLSPALLGSTILTVALFVRMGSMFTIPALVVWLIVSAPSLRSRLRTAAIMTGVMIALYATNVMLTRLYSRDTGLVGSNFSYTICGLTIGEIWSVCEQRYANEVPEPRTDKAVTDFLYAKAWENFRARPSVFFLRLWAGAKRFISHLPKALLWGYASDPPPDWFPRVLFWSALLLASAFALYRSNWRDRAFWGVLWASIISSAAVVMFDDGKRVLSSIYPMITLFLVLGLSGPNHQGRRGPIGPKVHLVRNGIVGLGGFAAALFVMPATAHWLWKPATMVQVPVKPDSRQHIVFGGHRISGVLVVADDARLPWGLPAVHLSSFKAMIRRSRVEYYQGLANPIAPPTPFGFIVAPRVERGVPSGISYIVPPHVLEQRHVAQWRFTIEEWQQIEGFGSYWFFVTRAEPLPQ